MNPAARNDKIYPIFLVIPPTSPDQAPTAYLQSNGQPAMLQQKRGNQGTKNEYNDNENENINPLQSEGINMQNMNSAFSQMKSPVFMNGKDMGFFPHYDSKLIFSKPLDTLQVQNQQALYQPQHIMVPQPAPGNWGNDMFGNLRKNTMPKNLDLNYGQNIKGEQFGGAFMANPNYVFKPSPQRMSSFEEPKQKSHPTNIKTTLSNALPEDPKEKANEVKEEKYSLNPINESNGESVPSGEQRDQWKKNLRIDTSMNLFDEINQKEAHRAEEDFNEVPVGPSTNSLFGLETPTENAKIIGATQANQAAAPQQNFALSPTIGGLTVSPHSVFSFVRKYSDGPALKNQGSLSSLDETKKDNQPSPAIIAISEEQKQLQREDSPSTPINGSIIPGENQRESTENEHKSE